jgi:hypothetical protein
LAARGKGNDKGKVEGPVGYARRNFLVPIPVFDSFAVLNEHLLGCCRKRMSDRLRGHAETIGERLQRDLAALQKPLPPPTAVVPTPCANNRRGREIRSSPT